MTAAQIRRARRTNRHRGSALSCSPLAAYPILSLGRGSAAHRAPAGYARFIGRVGALAVALGVGAAVATNFGVPVAHADETADAPSVNEQPAAEQEQNGTPQDEPDNTAPVVQINGEVVGARGGDDPEQDHHGASVPQMNVEAQGVIKREHEENELKSSDLLTEVKADTPPRGAPQNPLPQDGATELPTAPTIPVNTAPSSNPTPPPPPGKDPFTPGNNPFTPVTDKNADTNTSTLRLFDANTGGADLDVGLSMTNFTEDSAPRLFVAAASAAGTPAPAPLVNQPHNAFEALLGTPAALANIAITAVSSFLSSILAPGPTTPAPPVMLFVVLGWVQRELQRTFCNQSPTAVTDSVSTSEDVATTITVLANDTDGDLGAGDVLTVADYTQPTNGAVVLNPNGTFTYTPAADFNGTDTFTYTVSDEASPWHIHGLAGFFGGGGHASSTTVTVTVGAVNDAPDAVDDAVDTDLDTAATGNVLTNDTDIDGDALVVTTTAPMTGTYGTVTIATDGTYTYTPHQSQGIAVGSGGGAFTLSDPAQVTQGTVDDFYSSGTSNYVAIVFTPTTTQTYEFGQTTAPVDTVMALYDGTFDPNSPTTNQITIVDDSDSTDTCGTQGFCPRVSADLTAGQPVIIVISTYSPGDPLGLPQNLYTTGPGIFAGSSDALAAGEIVTDTFTYEVSDGNGGTDTAALTVTVTGVNDAPIITAVDPGSPNPVTGIINGSVTATDVDGDTLTFTVPVTDTTYGSVSINSQTGEFVYTPDVPVPSSIIPGTDFESGTLAGWNVGTQTGTFDPTVDLPNVGGNVGDGVSVSTGSITFSSPARPEDQPPVPAREWVYTPDGHAGVLSPTDAQTFAQAGTALGLTAAQQQAIITTSTSSSGPPQDAAWISKTVHLEAGTTYTMSWNYVSPDYQPFNDGSITTLVYQGGGPAPTVYVNNYEENYAILGYTNTGTGDYSTGSYGGTGWQTSTYRVTQTGDYTLGFAVFNIGDKLYDPILLVDSQGGTTLRDGQLYAPVPPNSPTAPHTVDDTFTVTVSDGNGGTDEVDVTVQVTVIGTPQTLTV
jgi:VCBS repeat-containing protein